MYKVLLVADNKNTKEPFVNSRLWSELNFQIIDVLSSKDNIISVLEATLPDVLICPITNKFTDGSNLSRYIFQNHITTKIVLYGRKNYDYVKLALNSKASGYVSFPFDQNEFTQTLLMLKQELDAQSILPSPILANDDNLSLLREQFFINLIKGTYTSTQHIIASFYELDLSMDFDHVQCCMLLLKIDSFEGYLKTKWKYGKEALYTAINNFFSRYEQTLTIFPIFRSGKDIWAIALGQKDTNVSSFTQTIQGHIKNASRNMNEILELVVNIQIENIFDSLLLVAQSSKNKDLLPDGALLNIMNHSNAEKNKGNEKAVIYRSKEYINNCFNKDICLDDVAEFVYLSPAYFSRLFKQETGENFIDYLIKVRMDNAKKYLHSPKYKTYEISQLVGYKKSKYFSKLFRKYTGYTPTEYRTMINHERQNRQMKKI